MPLPAPSGHLALEGVSACAPGSNLPILRNLSFSLEPGTVLGIIGPSASGKSTLARLLVGLWPTTAGKVRLDGADIYAWDKQELGPYIGYLPQDIELFDGTLGENIARFSDGDPAAIIDAAQAVGIHELIAEMPKAYDSRIGEDGAALSGGQRQRVALARAIYGLPRLLVLDEPNANLDEAGEQALLRTIGKLKAQGTTTIVISHRTSILPAVDQLLILRDGAIQSIGPRDEVLSRMKPAAAPATPAIALSSI
jgi:ATP-binding cassette subfamily C exporter for protease/lipase